MPERPLLLQSITFTDAGVIVDYRWPAKDIKSNGLQVQHTLLIPAGEDYDEGIEELTSAAHALTVDAVEDLMTLGPPQPRRLPADMRDDDDEDNPTT